MRIAGLLLLLAGWGITVESLRLLPPGVGRNAFVLAGVGVEVVGLVLVARSHVRPRGSAR